MSGRVETTSGLILANIETIFLFANIILNIRLFSKLWITHLVLLVLTISLINQCVNIRNFPRRFLFSCQVVTT